MLGRSRRRRANIEQTLAQCLMFAGQVNPPPPQKTRDVHTMLGQC